MKMMKKVAKVMSKASLKVAESTSASASLFGYHQPKEPKALKKLAKKG